MIIKNDICSSTVMGVSDSLILPRGRYIHISLQSDTNPMLTKSADI